MKLVCIVTEVGEANPLSLFSLCSPSAPLFVGDLPCFLMTFVYVLFKLAFIPYFVGDPSPWTVAFLDAFRVFLLKVGDSSSLFLWWDETLLRSSLGCPSPPTIWNRLCLKSKMHISFNSLVNSRIPPKIYILSL